MLMRTWSPGSCTRWWQEFELLLFGKYLAVSVKMLNVHNLWLSSSIPRNSSFWNRITNMKGCTYGSVYCSTVYKTKVTGNDPMVLNKVMGNIARHLHVTHHSAFDKEELAFLFWTENLRYIIKWRNASYRAIYVIWYYYDIKNPL